MVAPANLCVICKGGKHLCGVNPCPLLAKFNVKQKLEIGREFSGPSTSVFVGHSNYPNVFVGPIGAIENENLVDNPAKWFGMEYSKIIEMRSLTIRSKAVQNVKSKNRFVEENQLLAMSKKPTDVDLKFLKKPNFKVSFSDVTQPMGPSAPIEKMKIVENPKIPHKVDKVVDDELKAVEQVNVLYKNFDIYYITNIFTSGALGKYENQKLVPTRWSITAVDDILAKEMMKRIREYPEVNSYFVYESKYLDNHFVILLMPGRWEYENFEAWALGSSWAQQAKETFFLEEYEPFEGRKTYADKEGGGYYAARFAVCEALDKMKRQARVIVFREISEGYIVPLGVWQVRENVRNAMKSDPKKFQTLGEALSYINSKLSIPISRYKQQSRILQQKSLFDFAERFKNTT
ncbi:MAG: hypothetical protein J7K73_00775 [Nanoarchaeota archaeon]|nr:hypothetical protein [Nanoarchaeota archaeon]